MPALLDVLFSMILGFTIIFIIINANIVVGEGTFSYRTETMVQESLISVATLVESEFRNMGYGVKKEDTDNTGVILLAERNRIVFKSDFNNNGNVDIIEYYVGDPEDVPVMNDSIRVLHRQVNDEPPRGIGYVTKFDLTYFDFTGQEFNPAPNPGNVKMIEIEIEVQNPYALASALQQPGEDAYYSTTLWRQTRLGSKNFNTR